MSNVATKAVLDAHRPGSFAECRAINYAAERLQEGADPSEVLAELEAARDEIDGWVELEAQHGIAEVFKLLGQWLTTSWGGGEKVPAAAWIDRAPGVPIDPALLEQREAADAVFNLWREVTA